MPFSENSQYPENQFNSQPKDNNSDKIASHYKDNPEARQLAQKQNTKEQNLTLETQQAKKSIEQQSTQERNNLSQEVLTPQNIDKLLNTYSNLIQSNRQTLKD
ncbi:MAG: hypothetical protein LBC61_02640, partial [Candidatus Peribacteria bacterium]|nr:hypothetical protein [Candidatus Peribacteria bacterium]